MNIYFILRRWWCLCHMSYGTYVDFTKTFTSICSYLEQSYNWGILNSGWGLSGISILALVQQLSLWWGGGGEGWRVRMVQSTCLPQKRPGFKSQCRSICGLSLLLVLSRAPRGFSPGTLVFHSPQKPTFPNSNSTRNQVDEEPIY